MCEQMNLETYKQEVKEYMTKTLKVSTTVANNVMEEYEDDFQEFLKVKLKVKAVATGMLTHLL